MKNLCDYNYGIGVSYLFKKKYILFIGLKFTGVFFTTSLH